MLLVSVATQFPAVAVVVAVVVAMVVDSFIVVFPAANSLSHEFRHQTSPPP